MPKVRRRNVAICFLVFRTDMLSILPSLVYFLFTVDAPVVSMIPNIGSPIYSNVEAPLRSASSLPAKLMVASLAPLRATLAFPT